jgi:putative DNA primase/helicase
VEKVIEHLRAEGYPVDTFQADGKIHRFPLDHDDKKHSGWYMGHTNYRQDTGELYYFVVYGDWRSGEQKKYCSLAGKLPPSQARAHKQQMEAARKAVEAEREADYAAAAEEAREFWESLTEEGDSPYLERKQIAGRISGVRFEGKTLYVPIRDCSGKLLSLEQISPDGRKLSWSGAKKSGGFFVFETPSCDKSRVFIAEGFATAASVHLATGAVAVCAFGTGNLKSVATSLKKLWPERQFVICGDLDKNEKSNSRELAEKAAKAILCACVFPNLTGYSGSGLTDFNDLHAVAGLSEVAKQLAQPTALAVIKLTGLEIVETPFPDEREDGKRLGTYENVRELMRRLGVVVRYNGISKREEMLIPDLAATVDNEANVKLGWAISWCERCRIPTGNLQTYLTMLADSNRENPVATWIESRAWDGVSRLQQLFDTLKSSNPTLKERFMKLWLLTAVAAAYEPEGVCAQGMLVLQGAQYMGKTKWFRNLCPKEFRTDGAILRPDDKDSVMKVISHWLVELGELDATFRKADINQLKAFVSNTEDIIRRPYARQESKYSRRTVFFASVNDPQFLNDPTGNRRFWTVDCDSIDFNHDIDMQQLWAEVYELYKAGESWLPTAEDIRALNEHNKQFEAVDPIEEKIEDYFGWDKGADEVVSIPMNATEVCQKIGYEKPTKSDANTASRILRKYGLKPDRRKRYWVPMPKDQSMPQIPPPPAPMRYQRRPD